MKSKKRYEGYLLVDNRASPGVPDGLAISAGMPAGSGRGLFESATFTCSHCQTVVILNHLRTRERAFCEKCDHYLCDACGVLKAQSGVCRTFKQVVEEVQEQAVRDEQNGLILLS